MKCFLLMILLLISSFAKAFGQERPAKEIYDSTDITESEFLFEKVIDFYSDSNYFKNVAFTYYGKSSEEEMIRHRDIIRYLECPLYNIKIKSLSLIKNNIEAMLLTEPKRLIGHSFQFPNLKYLIIGTPTSKAFKIIRDNQQLIYLDNLLLRGNKLKLPPKLEYLSVYVDRFDTTNYRPVFALDSLRELNVLSIQSQPIVLSIADTNRSIKYFWAQIDLSINENINSILKLNCLKVLEVDYCKDLSNQELEKLKHIERIIIRKISFQDSKELKERFPDVNFEFLF